LWHRGIAYVALDAIERRIGEPISAERLALAVAGKPTRILTISDDEQEAALRPQKS
jgi:hypothetical protein